MESNDVFPDEMHLLQAGVFHVFVVAFAALFQQVFQAGQITHGRVQPHVKVFSGRIRYFNAEIGRVAADVPVAQFGLAVFVFGKPFARLVGHFGLEAAVLRPVLQVLHTARVREAEEEMLAAAQFGLCAGERRIGMAQVGGRINGAADFAVVAILVGRVAFGAFALDIPVGQKHAFLRVEKLLDGAHFNQAGGFQILVYGPG